MNTTSDIARHSAVSNALASIRKDRRFPAKVLVGRWEDYAFFDPFVMFSREFIDVANLLLTGEKASAIALINLGNVMPIDYNNPPVIFIDEKTKAKEYISELERKESPSGVKETIEVRERIAEPKSKKTPLSWRVLVDRYVCASDKGNWSIYCERENDVAVLAFRKGFSQSTYLGAQKLLKAKSIGFASSAGDLELFDFEKLLPDWKATLVAEHFLTQLQ